MIEFRCKDRTLARHYDFTFRKRFEALLEKCPPEWLAGARLRMMELMLTEAKRQEHYDYTEDEFGTRVVISNADGSPVLLIPEVIIDAQTSA